MQNMHKVAIGYLALEALKAGSWPLNDYQIVSSHQLSIRVNP